METNMDIWQILFGSIASIGILIGIYFKFRQSGSKDKSNRIEVAGSIIGNQTIQQADKIIINHSVVANNSKQKIINRINLKSDKEIRDYIEKEMENLTLINADFDKLAKKFIDATVNWIVKVDQIRKITGENVEVSFSSCFMSRSERFIVNPDEFPLIQFAKKNDKFKIEAQIKHLDITTVILDRVSALEKA
jgi:hypothetical protein